MQQLFSRFENLIMETKVSHCICRSLSRISLIVAENSTWWVSGSHHHVLAVPNNNAMIPKVHTRVEGSFMVQCMLTHWHNHRMESHFELCNRATTIIC